MSHVDAATLALHDLTDRGVVTEGDLELLANVGQLNGTTGNSKIPEGILHIFC